MIAHVVLLKPKADLSAEAQRALVSAFEQAVEQIPRVRAVRVGRRVMHGASYEASALDADYIVAIDFDDLAALAAYLRHPMHEELGRRFAESIHSAWIYDFEVGGIGDLAQLVSRRDTLGRNL